MKKPLLLAAIAASLAIPATASAQSRELKRDRQEIRVQKQDVRQAKRNGTPKMVQNERRDVRHAKQEYRRDWRDWRDYRKSHKRQFKRTRFDAPFRYSRFRTGGWIGQSYYAPRYVLGSYWQYGLPRPGYGMRYVRHFDDVLLVNIRTGRIMQVYYNFFW